MIILIRGNITRQRIAAKNDISLFEGILIDPVLSAFLFAECDLFYHKKGKSQLFFNKINFKTDKMHLNHNKKEINLTCVFSEKMI